MNTYLLAKVKPKTSKIFRRSSIRRYVILIILTVFNQCNRRAKLDKMAAKQLLMLTSLVIRAYTCTPLPQKKLKWSRLKNCKTEFLEVARRNPDPYHTCQIIKGLDALTCLGKYLLGIDKMKLAKRIRNRFFNLANFTMCRACQIKWNS